MARQVEAVHLGSGPGAGPSSDLDCRAPAVKRRDVCVKFVPEIQGQYNIEDNLTDGWAAFFDGCKDIERWQSTRRLPRRVDGSGERRWPRATSYRPRTPSPNRMCACQGSITQEVDG